MKNSSLYSRRKMLKKSFTMIGLVAVYPVLDIFSNDLKRRYQIGICDWTIGKRGEVAAIEYAQKIGLDGVMVSLGNVANDMHLRQKDVQQAYKQAVKQYRIQVSSIAIGELNNIPYKSASIAEEWVSDSIDVAKAMNCKNILIPFFNKGDIKGDKAGQKEVIKRFKKVAPKAEQAGVVLGIESWLSADEVLGIIHAIGSENVRVYYDVANSHKMGYDIYEEIAFLGNKYICEIHAKENGHLLGQGKIDFVKVKRVLDNVGYQGWIILEGGIPSGADLFNSCVTNTQFIRSIFSEK